MKRPNRDDIVKEFNIGNRMAYGSYVESEYYKRLEQYADYLEQLLKQ